MRDDEEEAYGDVPRGWPRVVYRNGNGNGNGDVNKIVWAAAGFLVVVIIGIQSFVAAKVWDISERVARLEARSFVQAPRDQQ